MNKHTKNKNKLQTSKNQKNSHINKTKIKQTQSNSHKHQKNTNVSSSKDEIMYDLKMKLLKKIYINLFTSKQFVFKTNNITFDDFLFEYANDIFDSFNNNQTTLTYSELLQNISDLIDKRLSIQYNKLSPLELKRHQLKQKENDDWALLAKYQSEIFKEEEKQRLIKSNESIKQFYKDLKLQEEQRKQSKEELLKKKQQKQEQKLIEEQQRITKESKENEKKIAQIIMNEQLLQSQVTPNSKSKGCVSKQREKMLKEIIEDNKNLSKDNNAMVKIKIDSFMLMQNNDLSKLNDISNVKEDSIDDNISDIVDKIIEQKEKMKIYNMISSKENKCIQDHKIKGINEQIDLQVDKILNDKEQELNYNKYNELYNLSKETYN